MEVRAVDPSAAVPADAARPVYVVVSVAEGVHLPAHWTNDVTREFVSFKPDGTPADELYRVGPHPPADPTRAVRQKPAAENPGD